MLAEAGTIRFCLFLQEDSLKAVMIRPKMDDDSLFVFIGDLI